MRIALVINTKAGSMAGGITPRSIRDKVAAAGLEAVPEPDEMAPLPERLAAAARLPGIDALVVAGGDGTMACAAGAMSGRDIPHGLLPLGLLPLGTMNLLAKDLELPLDLDAAIANLETGSPRRIDVGDVNGHVFMITSVLGMPARMAKHREAQRKGFDPRGAVRWLAGLLRHLGRYPRLTVTGTIDGVPRQLRFRMLAVVNNDFVERPGHILVRSPVDGGRLTLYVSSRLTLWRTVRIGFGFALGDWRRLPGLERHDIETLSISTRRRSLRVINDGEVTLIDSPLHYRMRPRALAVILPSAAAAPNHP